MRNKKFLKKDKYFIEYTSWDLDYSVSYHVVSFIDYRKFAKVLRIILADKFCSITSVYKDVVHVFSD